jgi:leucyl aminopeptidase
MRTTLSTTPPAHVAADLLLVPVAGGDPAGAPLVRELDRRLGGGLLRDARRAGFRGRIDQELVYQTHGAAPSRVVVLCGIVGDGGIGPWYEIAEALTRHAARLRAHRIAIALGGSARADVLHALCEGAALAGYRFARYRSAAPAVPSIDLLLLVPAIDASMRRAVADAAIFARATALARDLANTPAADLGPLDLARAARRLAGPALRVRVHDRPALERLRMGAILGVGRGSERPPCLIELSYRPGRVRRRVALVGKGITFDSGGLSIKPADAMQTQKRDMAGGAIVLGVMSVLPALRLPIEVRGYIPAAENMPSGTAMRPGDVLRVCNGTTIEVLNTDAEGRLVLADALAYAARRGPDLVLDFATLTAVVRSALGTRCAAILGTDRSLIDAMLAGAAEANELLWELPLIAAYRRDLDSPVADLKNIGEGPAGTIVAALFLREFVGRLPWAHVDFSSTVMSDGYPCHPKGASGYGVRTVLRCLTRLAQAPQAPRSRSPSKRRAQAAEQK